MATVKQVNAAFERALNDIASLDRALAAERKALKLKAFQAGRDMTASEIKRRKTIAATRLELSEALADLAVGTIDALDNADDVKALLQEVKATNQQLADDLASLKKKAAYAAKVAKVTSSLADAAEKIAKLAVKFGIGA